MKISEYNYTNNMDESENVDKRNKKQKRVQCMIPGKTFFVELETRIWLYFCQEPQN